MASDTVLEQAVSPVPSGQPFGQGQNLRPSDPVYLELLGFLWDEASILDRDNLLQWRDMLDRDITYKMPVCVTRKRRGGTAYETEAMHFDEDYGSLAFRIRRFEETMAWAADPPSRARRFVTGVRVWATEDPEIFDVSSSILVIRTSDDEFHTDQITAERYDQIRFRPGPALSLLSRRIVADQTTLGTHNLAIFL